MGQDNTDGKAIILLLLLIGVILGVLGISKFQNKELSTETVKEKIEEVLNPDESKKVEPKEVTIEELTGYVKTKMINDGLAKPDLIGDWTFDHYKKMGYLSSEPSVMYYSISGKFICNALEEGFEYPTCVYQQQLGDPDENGYYAWIVFVKVIISDDGYKLGEIIGDGSFQFNEQFVKAE